MLLAFFKGPFLFIALLKHIVDFATMLMGAEIIRQV
jgi:hypothetical protein